MAWSRSETCSRRAAGRARARARRGSAALTADNPSRCAAGSESDWETHGPLFWYLESSNLAGAYPSQRPKPLKAAPVFPIPSPAGLGAPAQKWPQTSESVHLDRGSTVTSVRGPGPRARPPLPTGRLIGVFQSLASATSSGLFRSFPARRGESLVVREETTRSEDRALAATESVQPDSCLIPAAYT